MIIAPGLAIGHIGKTAGDAVKRLVSALELPDVTLVPIASPLKHTPFQHWRGDLSGRDLVLTIRRLPAFVLSQFQHRRRDGRLLERPSGACMCRDYLADFYLRLYTDEGRLPIAAWLRSEMIRSDLTALLRRYYTLSEAQLQILDAGVTKPQMQYNHDLAKWFSRGQLQTLYAGNPLWTEIERRVYGDTLAENAD
jgi:hypothetical protein